MIGSADCLEQLRGEGKRLPISFIEPLEEKNFDEVQMYDYVKTYASLRGMEQTLAALPYARDLHEGQFRKGKEKVPYISHPLTLACHAIALGLDRDEIIATALLHDVCEDCGVTWEELPVGEEVRCAVKLLTKKPGGHDKKAYFEPIAKNEIALFVKLLDRVHNVSGMAGCFSKQKLVRYIDETEQWFYPKLQIARTDYPQYSNQVFLIEYHMVSVVNSLKCMLNESV